MASPTRGADGALLPDLQAQALMKENAWLRAIFDTDPECIKVLDSNGRLREINAAGLQILEADSLKEVENRCVYPMIAEEHRTQFRELTEQVFRGESGTLKFQIVGLKGTHRRLETHATPLRDAAGNVIALLGITRDVKSEHQFRALFEQAADGIAILSADGSFLDVNQGCCAMTGYSKEELLGMKSHQLVPPELESKAIATVEQILSGSPHLQEWTIVRKDGSLLCAEVNAQSLCDGRLLAIVRDISERKRAEAALRKSEQRFHKAFSLNPKGMAISTANDSKHIEVNEAYLRMFGFERSEVIGRTSLELGMWKDPAQREAALKEIHTTGKLQQFETVMQTKSGTQLDVEITAEIIEMEDRPCILGVLRDVTEYKRLSEQLRTAQRLEAIGRLAGGVAHDFNNFLNVISGYSELLLDETNDEQTRRQVEQILTASRKAAAVSAQLLAFGRQQVLQPVVMNLNDVLMDVRRLFPQLVRENIELSIRLCKEEAKVSADKTQLEQVIINLVANARDAMPTGGRLTIETACVRTDKDSVGFHSEIPQGSFAMLAVTDTGMGMDKPTQARIFEPFFTTKDVGKGTGMGLATVYGIVKQSNGFVYVYSEPGHGTTFRVYLPLAEGTVKAAVEKTNEAEREGLRGTEKVLLVEDEGSLRTLVQEYLTRLGYQVISAGDGREGLALAQAESIDILITDIVMPHQSGPELASKLHETKPSAKVIFVSGYADDAVAQQRLVEGASFLQKPYRLSHLAAKVRSVLDGA